MKNQFTILLMLIAGILLFIFAPACILAQYQIAPDKREKSVKNKQVLIADVRFEGLDPHYEYGENHTDNLYEHEIKSIFRENRVKLEEKAYNSADIGKATGLVNEWLFNKGFIAPVITVFNEQNPDASITIVFLVKRGAKTSVTDVQFVGNKIFTNQELKENTKHCLESDINEWETFDKDLYKYCLRRYTIPFMQSKGYLKALTESPKIQLAAEGLVVRIRIDEGIRYRIGQISIEGTKTFSSQEILEMLGQNTGDIADAKAIRDFFYEKLNNLYAGKGFIQFDVNIEVEINEPTKTDEDGTVEYAIAINEGKSFKVSTIEFVGVDQPTAQFLRNFVSIKDGQIFNRNSFEKSIEEINKMNPLDFIDKDKDVELITDDENEFVQIKIKIQEI